MQSEVYFLSDLGRHGWAPELGSPQAVSEFRDRSKRISEQARLVVIDLGQSGSDNLAVTDVQISEPYVLAGRDVNVKAQVKNFGRQPRTQQLVELFVDGRRAGEEHVDRAGRRRSHRRRSPIASIRPATMPWKCGWRRICWTSTTIAGSRCR